MFMKHPKENYNEWFHEFRVVSKLKPQSIYLLLKEFTSVLPGIIGLPENISASRHPALQRSMPTP